MNQEKTFRKVVKDSNFKVTPPRLLIFHYLRKYGLQSLPELVARSKGEIDRVSVYRTVDLFEQLGIARRVTIGWKYKIELSDIFLDHHHHITCLGCSKIVAVKENAQIEKRIDELVGSTDFIVISHQLELLGYCKDCQKLESRATRQAGEGRQ